jgi:Mce-associated membrane protein
VSSVRRLRVATFLLLGCAVVALTASAVVALRDAPGPDAAADLNVAVVDSDATDEVVEAVERGLGEILVYDYRHPHRAEQTAASFLTGDASEQYQRIYDALAAAGVRNRLVHHSTVSRIGVQRLTATSADLLVFLQQETVRTTDGATNQGPAQIEVEAVRVDDRWKVSSIELL